MKKRIVIILAALALAGFLSSCSTVQDCPALSYDEQNPTEQAA